MTHLKQEIAVMKRGVAIQRHVFLTVFRLRSLTEASSEASQAGGASGAGREQGRLSDARQRFTSNVLEYYEVGDQHCRPLTCLEANRSICGH